MPQRVLWRQPNGGRCHGSRQYKKNNKQRAKTNILRAFLFPGLTNPFPRRRILFPKVNFSFHESRSPVSEHKNPDFVLEMPENVGFEGQKRTRTSILCSKRPKTGVPKPKSAQKPRFCAREEGDWQWEEKILASGKATVAFLQITAHAFKMQMLHNQIINF